MRAYTRLEISLGFLILIILVYYGASLTKHSFTQAKESFNKTQIFNLEQGLRTMIKNENDLTKSFPSCFESWCNVDERMRAKVTNDQTDPPTEILPKLPKTSSNKYFRLKVSGPADFIIEGPSASSAQKCWIIDSNAQKSNTSKDLPTECSSF